MRNPPETLFFNRTLHYIKYTTYNSINNQIFFLQRFDKINSIISSIIIMKAVETQKV